MPRRPGCGRRYGASYSKAQRVRNASDGARPAGSLLYPARCHLRSPGIALAPSGRPRQYVSCVAREPSPGTRAGCNTDDSAEDSLSRAQLQAGRPAIGRWRGCAVCGGTAAGRASGGAAALASCLAVLTRAHALAVLSAGGVLQRRQCENADCPTHWLHCPHTARELIGSSACSSSGSGHRRVARRRRLLRRLAFAA